MGGRRVRGGGDGAGAGLAVLLLLGERFDFNMKLLVHSGKLIITLVLFISAITVLNSSNNC